MSIFYFHLVITTKAHDVDNEVSPRTIDNNENFKLLSVRESDYKTTKVQKNEIFFYKRKLYRTSISKILKKKSIISSIKFST